MATEPPWKAALPVWAWNYVVVFVPSQEKKKKKRQSDLYVTLNKFLVNLYSHLEGESLLAAQRTEVEEGAGLLPVGCGGAGTEGAGGRAWGCSGARMGAESPRAAQEEPGVERLGFRVLQWGQEVTELASKGL